MLTIRVHDEQLARQLEEIAEREQRPVEEVLKTMVARYPTNPSTSPTNSRDTDATRKIRRKAYAKARAYWKSVGDMAKASMSDEELDIEFGVFDQEGIPRLKSELISQEPPIGSLAYAAKVIQEMGGVVTEETLDVAQSDELLNDEFATYLSNRLRSDNPGDDHASSRLLVDSSYMYALFDDKNEKFAEASLVASIYQSQLVVPYVILTEVAYLFNRQGGVPAVLQFIDRLTAMQPQLEAVLFSDLARAREIMAHFRNSRLDFVDCCIMALAERLNITQVCTFDRRDFTIFRPKHVDYLEILP